MKIQQLFDQNLEEPLLEGTDMLSIKKFIYRAFKMFIMINDRNERLNMGFTLGMKYFPQHIYEGKMYRFIYTGAGQYKHWDAYQEKMLAAIVAKEKHKVMQMIKDYPQDVNSFTINKDFAAGGHGSDLHGVVVLEQSGRGLHLTPLMEELTRDLFNEQYTPPDNVTQEVLATLQPNLRIMSMDEFLPRDPNFVYSPDYL